MAETPQQIVDRVLREHKRYTGDGLPNEPVNAPLPVGDPQSGPYNPKKKDLRLGLKETLHGAAEETARASDEADRAEAAAAIAQQGGSGLAEFETRALAEAWPGVDPMPESIVIRGDASVDDGLGGTFVLGHASADTILVAGEGYGRANLAISAEPQSLTPSQRAQARENIGADSSVDSDGISNKSQVPGESVSDALNAVDEKIGPVLLFRSEVETANDGVIAFENIPQDFDLLLVRFKVRVGISANHSLRVRFTSMDIEDQEHYRQSVDGAGSSTSAGQATGQNSHIPAADLPHSGDNAAAFAVGQITFVDYSTPGGLHYGYGGSYKSFRSAAGHNQTSYPVTALFFWVGGASSDTQRVNWAVGSRIEVYGIRTADDVTAFWSTP